MSRRLLILALIAVPGVLAGCDSPKVLSKAKPGECYAVVGRDNLGAAKLAKTPCAGSPAAIAAVCPQAPAAPTTACPAPGVAEAVRGDGLKVETAAPSTSIGQRLFGHRAVSHQVVRRHAARQQTVRRQADRYVVDRSHYATRDDRVAKSGEVASLGIEYARVDQNLLGGPQGQYSDRYEQRDYDRQHEQRYERGGEDRQQVQRYERRQQQGYQAYAPPPPPPPVNYGHRDSGRIEYSERQAYGQGQGQGYQSHGQASAQTRVYRAESSSASSSYSSSSSSRSGHAGVDCDCDGASHGSPSPTPYDRAGFLTWRGKTPG